VGRLTDAEELKLALLDSEGREINRVAIDNKPSYALGSDLSIAIVANWVNTSLKVAGCPGCVGTHDVARMIESSMNDGRGIYSLMLPKNFSFTIQ
jgi:hypothetical protein